MQRRAGTRLTEDYWVGLCLHCPMQGSYRVEISSEWYIDAHDCTDLMRYFSALLCCK